MILLELLARRINKHDINLQAQILSNLQSSSRTLDLFIHKYKIGASVDDFEETILFRVQGYYKRIIGFSKRLFREIIALQQ